MKAAVYEQLREALLQRGLDAARKAFPEVEFDTMMAIYSQENTRRLRTQHHRFRAPHSVQQYIARYASGEDILVISKAFGMPPCVLARILLENMVGMSKPQAPAEVLARLREDLYRCIEADQVSSPASELIRRVAGMEYESLLYEELHKRGIAFKSEEALRTAGFSKTPDVKLEIPIGVKGRIVNWIDSKACFGEESNVKEQGTDQFQSYVNRFGPGMVIYWFGFVEELDDHPHVLLMDRFPEESEIYCLPCLPVTPATVGEPSILNSSNNSL